MRDDAIEVVLASRDAVAVVEVEDIRSVAKSNEPVRWDRGRRQTESFGLGGGQPGIVGAGRRRTWQCTDGA